MPPKPKFTSDEIILAALAIVSDRGVNSLTARELAGKMGCSTRPIFTVFSDMDELKHEVRKLAAEQLQKICDHTINEHGSFVEVAIEVIRFAKRDPNLYDLLFMFRDNQQVGFLDLMQDSERSERSYIEFISETYGLEEANARTLFRQMWIHCLGMGVMCVTQRYVFTDEEIVSCVVDFFDATLAHLREREGSQGGSTAGADDAEPEAWVLASSQ